MGLAQAGDNSWQVQLMFTIGGRPLMAEWVFDPRRRHVTPADDDAARLSLPEADLAQLSPGPRAPARATVTPIGSRLTAAQPPAPAQSRPEPAPAPEPAVSQARAAEVHPARAAEAAARAAGGAATAGRRGAVTTRRRGPASARPGGAPGGRAGRDGTGRRQPGNGGAAARPGPQGRRRPVQALIRAVLG